MKAEQLAQQEKARLAKETADRIARLEKEKNAKEEADRLAEIERNKIKDSEVKETSNPVIPIGKNYYIITISSPNLATAESWLLKMKRDFKDARILPQPNGYFRVGVYAARDREMAGVILEKVKEIGYNPAWISIE